MRIAVRRSRWNADKDAAMCASGCRIEHRWEHRCVRALERQVQRYGRAVDHGSMSATLSMLRRRLTGRSTVVLVSLLICKQQFDVTGFQFMRARDCRQVSRRSSRRSMSASKNTNSVRYRLPLMSSATTSSYALDCKPLTEDKTSEERAGICRKLRTLGTEHAESEAVGASTQTDLVCCR